MNKSIEKFWKDESNLKHFATWFEKEKQMKSAEDWYRVSIKDIKEKGGDGMVREYGLLVSNFFYLLNILKGALQKIYPHYDWKPWLFTVTPPGFWESEKNHLKYFQW